MFLIGGVEFSICKNVRSGWIKTLNTRNYYKNMSYTHVLNTRSCKNGPQSIYLLTLLTVPKKIDIMEPDRSVPWIKLCSEWRYFGLPIVGSAIALQGVVTFILSSTTMWKYFSASLLPAREFPRSNGKPNLVFSCSIKNINLHCTFY